MSDYNVTPIWRRPTFALVVLPLLAFLLNGPYLAGGFYADDFFFLNGLNLPDLTFSRWLGLWSIDDYPAFEHIWWTDPGWNATLWRPIPSLIIEGSLYLFGENPFPLHLLSLLLHAGVVTGLYLLVRSLTKRHGLAFFAGLFFITCEDHSLSVGWIATITDLLCVMFIMLSLLSHIRWLKRKRPAALILSWLALIVAMGCKETAVVAPIAIVLLTLFMSGGLDGGDAGRRQLRARAKRGLRDFPSWLPAVIILAAYMALYKSLGFGAADNLVYTDPLADTGRYFAHLIVRLPVMWLATLSIVPSFLSWYFPETARFMAILGLVAFLIWVTALWPFRSRPLVWWAFTLYVVALLPQAAAEAGERGLYFAMIPAGILLAMAATSVASIARRMNPGSPVAPRWTRFVGWITLLGILLPGTVLSAVSPWIYYGSFERPERQLRTALPHIEKRQPAHILILNTSGIMHTLYTWDILNYHSQRPLDVWLLSAANGIFTLDRTGDSSFVIHTDRAGWLDNLFARVMRCEEWLDPDRRYETELFSATLLEMTEDGSDVLAVRFDMVRPLDDPGWLFLRWNGRAFVPLDIAALEEGETAKLADTSDLWKGM